MKPNSSKTNFSLVIPTLGRKNSLRRLLNSLSEIKYSSDFEVIIIENNKSEASLKNLVSEFQTKLKSLRYLYLKDFNISKSRNLGIKSAKYDYILCLDDDVTVNQHILTAYSLAWALYPKAKIIGGGMIAKLENNLSLTAAQSRMIEKYPWCFSHMPPQVVDYKIKKGQLLYSGNISIKRSHLPEYFNENMGREFYLNMLIGAEDYELCFRILLSGGQIYLLADGRTVVDHYISVKRLSKTYLRYRFLLAGIELVAMEKQLKKKFKNYREFSYLHRAFENFRNFKNTLFDPNERLMMLSYLINRSVFNLDYDHGS